MPVTSTEVTSAVTKTVPVVHFDFLMSSGAKWWISVREDLGDTYADLGDKWEFYGGKQKEHITINKAGIAIFSRQDGTLTIDAKPGGVKETEDTADGGNKPG